MLPRKKIITPMEAFALWERHNEEKETKAPELRYLYRYLKRYQGLVCYRSSDSKICVYEDVWMYYIENGFPDLAVRANVMELAVALRYLKDNLGINPKYTLRELRKDLKTYGMIIKSKDGIERQRVRRSDIHRLMAIWNGNR